MEWYRDPAWQFIGIIIGSVLTLILFFASSWLTIRFQSRRDLRYDVIYNGPLFILTDSAAGKVRVTFGSKVINDANLVMITLMNTGNTPIEAGNFEHPIIISVAEQVEILHADVELTEPANMKVSLKHDKNSIEVPPTLLNPRDTVSIKFIIDKPTDNIVFDSRIVGVGKAKPRKSVLGNYWSINGNKFTIYFLISQFFSVGLMLFVLTFLAPPAQDLQRANQMLNSLRPLGPTLMLVSLFLFLFVLGTIGGYVKGDHTKVTVGKVKRKGTP